MTTTSGFGVSGGELVVGAAVDEIAAGRGAWLAAAAASGGNLRVRGFELVLVENLRRRELAAQPLISLRYNEPPVWKIGQSA
jgi:hypothetical protein